MKVEGPGAGTPINRTRKTDKAGASSDASEFRGLMGADDVAEAAPTTQSASIARVDTLLAIQAAENPAEKASKGRMRMRSEGLLKELDKIRVGMLTGSLTVGHMVDIADVVASHRERIVDPALASILDEIDLRAQVEIAKMRISLDSVNS